MKHNIRINGVAKEVDCELGSGRLDCEGREIFEGDKLEYIAKVNEIFVGTVRLKSAEFVVDGVPFVEFLSLSAMKSKQLKVVGHVEDKQ